MGSRFIDRWLDNNRGRTTFAVHLLLLSCAAMPYPLLRSVAPFYLVGDAGYSAAAAGVFFYASTILGIIVTYVLGRGLIDRFDAKVSIIMSLCTWCTSAALVGISYRSASYLGAAAILDGLSQLLIPSLFMYDERYSAKGTQRIDSAYRTRFLISVVWLIGPPCGFYLYWLGGFQCVLVAMLMCAVISISFFLREARTSITTRHNQKKSDQGLGGVQVSGSRWFVVSAYLTLIGVTSINVIYSLTLPLYLVEERHLETWVPGVMFGAMAFAELIFIGLLGRISRFCTDGVIILIGIAVGVLFFALLPFVDNVPLLMLLHTLYGIHFCLSSVTGLSILQRTGALSMGSLAARFFSASKLGSLFGTGGFALLGGSMKYSSLFSLVCLPVIVLAVLPTLVLVTGLHKKCE